ncbi:MAG: hypothetical protein HY457_02730 [Parcubacteria group bacterium]|nr:hypothetical protein [Parcubacteria group bacterium]
MTSPKTLKIVGGPGRFELLVSQGFNDPGCLSHTPTVVFKFEPGAVTYRNSSIEVEITALECTDRVFGIFHFRGKVQSNWYVEGTYCVHNHGGEVILHAPSANWNERLLKSASGAE